MEETFCPYRYWYKYRMCVHVLIALRQTGKAIPGEKQVKKRSANRSRKRKGRAPTVGHALFHE
ncbi:hypothetical protein GN958_ATG03751 [Phytophthora infestans]|uniref:SWIM-type domain-containing protein n=1 Tax=Phytophthora infestans TaxID=4787 RepID=A0A8S9V6V0_PHYIN|nr:hypothetical protein GN958_ATG03751 [Phytophthora infestans]